MSKLNIIVATHGRFGEELVKSAEMIIGPTENIYNLSLLPEKSFEDFLQEAKELFEKIEGPTIGLVDLFGGTPSNVLTALTRHYDHKVLSGVNLPVLIDLYMKAMTLERIELETIIQEEFKVFNESMILTNERLEV
ncbi:PTS sugar transporter subunit IIA [Candidatus Enterococcus murrayae]|uniref:PTS sugar transporter subunit IIA n=1 Tax=Candidatus Enterococcus murrayae TaxID=2815321 RepID=A0ABS3HD81_9ENTE|nr:PTS sugar transporter subunit IIA [Enterococcus sp. MJM16]MBO0451402.1 PTS sugar transporter subunit IIA [Enterococcus sp. MJM16]